MIAEVGLLNTKTAVSHHISHDNSFKFISISLELYGLRK